MTTSKGPHSARMARAVWRGIKSVLRRAYALGLIVLITWVSYRAFQYLFVALLAPSEAPQQITGIPERLDAATLATQQAEWQGLSSVTFARQPAAHYHRIDTWIQPDPRNNCTTSGCHAPLPHQERKETRAFLNMHATSIHCGACHMEHEAAPLPLGWYALDTGERVDAPSVLRAYEALLDLTESGAAAPEDLRRRVVELMKRAAAETNAAPGLIKLARHFSAVRITSEAFDKLARAALTEMPRHFRGEYAAKIALTDASGATNLAHPGTQDAVRRYLEAPANLDDAARLKLLNEIHPLRRSVPRGCGDCHGQDARLVDWRSLGYPPLRVGELTDPLVARMIAHIAAGQPFHLPQFLAPPATPTPGAPPPAQPPSGGP